MKLFTGWILSAGLVLVAGAANAQILAPYDIGSSPYSVASDIDGPYAAMPPEAPAPRYGPMLLPAPEVYTIVRENGFSPLGIPQQRGRFYTIAVIDRGGDDGRLVIDARDGRIIRFMPAARMGDNLNDDLTAAYGPVGPLPPIRILRRGVPRPPAPVPRVASRTPLVPMPKAAPPHTGEPKPLAAKPARSRRSNRPRYRRNRPMRQRLRLPRRRWLSRRLPRYRSCRPRRCRRCRGWNKISPQTPRKDARRLRAGWDDRYFLRPAAVRISSAISLG